MGKLFCGKKNKLKFKMNIVVLSEGFYVWIECSGKGKGKKWWGFYSMRLFGFWLMKVLNIKCDFDKLCDKNVDVWKFNWRCLFFFEKCCLILLIKVGKFFGYGDWYV